MTAEVTPYNPHISRETYIGNPDRPWPDDALIAARVTTGTSYLARIITNRPSDKHYADDYVVRARDVSPYFPGVGFRIPAMRHRRLMIWPLELQQVAFAPVCLDTNETLNERVPNIPAKVCVDGFGQLRKRRSFFVETWNHIYGYLMDYEEDDGGSKVELSDGPHNPRGDRSPRLPRTPVGTKILVPN